jgi:hypothetical protein
VPIHPIPIVKNCPRNTGELRTDEVVHGTVSDKPALSRGNPQSGECMLKDLLAGFLNSDHRRIDNHIELLAQSEISEFFDQCAVR